MGTIDESHGSPLPLAAQRQRHLPASAALSWLGAGWRDLWLSPLPSLVYGFVVFLVSLAIVWGLFRLELDYILFPALAGFMVVGPLLAIGLYQKSRDIEQGRSVSLARMIFVKAASGGQVWFTGAILCLLMLVWMRAAVIIYALFFGLRPFPGLHDVATMLVTTPTGWATWWSPPTAFRTCPRHAPGARATRGWRRRTHPEGATALTAASGCSPPAAAPTRRPPTPPR